MKKLKALSLLLIICLNLSTCAFPYARRDYDFVTALREAALCGDFEAGRAAAALRNTEIREGQLNEEPFSFDELFLLSKFILSETQRHSLSEEYLQCAGEVLLNRLDSPEFPDTLEELLSSDSMYADTRSEEFSSLMPNRRSIAIAMKLLSGDRMLPPSVVYQREENTGNVYASFCDRVLGFTYFCHSDNPGLYIDSPPEARIFELSSKLPPGFSVNGSELTALKTSCTVVHPGE